MFIRRPTGRHVLTFSCAQFYKSFLHIQQKVNNAATIISLYYTNCSQRAANVRWAALSLVHLAGWWSVFRSSSWRMDTLPAITLLKTS